MRMRWVMIVSVVMLALGSASCYAVCTAIHCDQGITSSPGITKSGAAGACSHGHGVPSGDTGVSGGDKDTGLHNPSTGNHDLLDNWIVTATIPYFDSTKAAVIDDHLGSGWRRDCYENITDPSVTVMPSTWYLISDFPTITTGPDPTPNGDDDSRNIQVSVEIPG